MKKIYSTSEYKEFSKRRTKLFDRKAKKKKRDYIQKTINGVTQYKGNLGFSGPIEAPSDFRLIYNTILCLEFFRSLRNANHYNTTPSGKKFVSMTLRYVTKIDYATISVLTALSDDLKNNKITLRGDFPTDKTCKEFLSESGFLNHMYDNKNKRYPKSEMSEMIFFEKGCGIFSQRDNIKMGEMVKNGVKYLSGKEGHFNPVKNILLEICGNSIEHAYNNRHKHWLLGMKYENDKVIFTVADVGKGILKTLNIKFKNMFYDRVTFKNDVDILFGAFNRKYGSSTEEINRNKGLPAVKYNYEEGNILNLKVLTNNVILHFGNDGVSEVFPKGSPWFMGTLYQWELKKECLTSKQYYESN